MKAFIAYAFVVAGLPVLVGGIIGIILNMPVSLIIGLSRSGSETPLEAAEAAARDPQAWLFGGNEKMAVRDYIAHACLDIFKGFGAILAAVFLFHLLGLTPRLSVLIIVAAWHICLAVSFGLSWRVWFTSLVGIGIGWFAALGLFTF